MASDNIFKIIEEPEEQSTADKVGFQLLHLGLKALSQRAMVAASALFTLLTVASAFWLFMAIPNPNNMQLTALGMYSAFVLAINVIVKR
jgi:hypothetical protein